MTQLLSHTLYGFSRPMPGDLLQSPEITAPPSGEPIDAAAMKLWLRADQAIEDELINDLIGAARERIEEAYGAVYLTQTVKAAFGGRCTYVVLPRTPVSSITSATIEESGTTTTLDPSALILMKGKQPTVSRADNGILNTGDVLTLTFDCGYATADLIPRIPLQAIRMTVADWYSHRGTFTVGTVVARLPETVRRMMSEAGYARI